jgi:hypothetical protein
MLHPQIRAEKMEQIMGKHSALAAFSAATLLTFAPGAAFAGGASQLARSHLEFVVVRNDEAIGSHVIDVLRDGDTTSVKISTNVVVKVAFIPVYRFEHAGIETWKGRQLIALKSRTNDDGTSHQLAVVAEGDHLRVAGDGSQATAAAAILPASLWNAGIVYQKTLLNTLDGTQMPIAVIDKGEEAVLASGKQVAAHHYTISGGINREVWFDRSNTLVRVEFAGKDGSDIVYQLR